MHLTPAEQRVLTLLGQGQTQARIAETIHCSPKTIQAHIGHIKHKLDIPHLYDLIIFAARYTAMQQRREAAQPQQWGRAEAGWLRKFEATLDHLTVGKGEA